MAKNFKIFNEFNILYLEDDTNLLKNTKDILDDYFANVFAVTTTRKAFAVLKEKKVDVIISDILLKDENGLEFIKSIKSNNNFNIPIIITTAHSQVEYLLDSIKLKVDNYLIKPIDFNLLKESLYDILYPKYQNKDFIRNNNIIKIISIIFNSKQIDVIKYMMNNLNSNNEFKSSYMEITSKINISKPTLIKLLKTLSEKNIFVKVSHKTYMFQEKELQNIKVE